MSDLTPTVSCCVRRLGLGNADGEVTAFPAEEEARRGHGWRHQDVNDATGNLPNPLSSRPAVHGVKLVTLQTNVAAKMMWNLNTSLGPVCVQHLPEPQVQVKTKINL